LVPPGFRNGGALLLLPSTPGIAREAAGRWAGTSTGVASVRPASSGGSTGAPVVAPDGRPIEGDRDPGSGVAGSGVATTPVSGGTARAGARSCSTSVVPPAAGADSGCPASEWSGPGSAAPSARASRADADSGPVVTGASSPPPAAVGSVVSACGWVGAGAFNFSQRFHPCSDNPL
jgi:hypothetical protein